MNQITVSIFAVPLAISPIVSGTRVDFDGDGFADLAVGVPGEDFRLPRH